MPEEINGYSIIAHARIDADSCLILGEGWKNDGLAYVVATLDDGATEWRNGTYFDNAGSRNNKADGKARFVQRVRELWG